MMEKGAERKFLCLDNEYINKTKNDRPKKNNNLDRNPIR